MGLDAFVHCRCAIDGYASPAPIAFALTFEGLNCDPDLSMEQLRSFDRWLEDGCSHDGMRHRATRIANWTGYRKFQSALEHVGLARFPALDRELPNVNGGSTPSTAAKQCLIELALFEQSSASWPIVRLIDVVSGHVFAESVNARDGVFILNGSEGWNAALSTDGTCVVYEHATTPNQGGHTSVLFEASEFTQTQIEDGRWQWTAPNGESFVTAKGLEIYGADPSTSHPSALSVVCDSVGPPYVASVVGSLREIFEASVEVDMPVHWT